MICGRCKQNYSQEHELSRSYDHSSTLSKTVNAWHAPSERPSIRLLSVFFCQFTVYLEFMKTMSINQEKLFFNYLYTLSQYFLEYRLRASTGVFIFWRTLTQPTQWSNTLRQFVGNSQRIVRVYLTILWRWG